MENGSQSRRAVNLFLNSKGGVGKSHHAVLLVQAYQAAALPVIAIDADATSASFSSFHGLGVKRIQLMEGDAINPRVFDGITEEFLTTDSNFVIDTGASAFVELNRYLLKNKIPEHVREADKRLVAHIILTGGSTFRETSANLEAIASQTPPSVEVVVWINDHFGPVIPAGRRFEDLEVYKASAGRITAIVHLADHTFTEPATFGGDVKQMMSKGLTFGEIRESPEFTIMAKARLRQIEREVNGQLTPIITL
ncbi:MAG: conjugal transfer protein TraL [Rhodomicrobium sp.]|nr:conjugal transfer protein TraL [Rhodomicrobium sp.]